MSEATGAHEGPRRSRVLVVAGTRPEGIKLAPLVLALRKSSFFETELCTSGQHRELLDKVLSLFGLAPDVDLNLMRPNQTLNGLASRALAAFDQVFSERRPDWVVVQGDTSTAFVAALAAFNCGIRVAHLEAGLRSGDSKDPFPEEANRRMTACLADLHLAPTESARANLIAEGIDVDRIVVTGNTVVDAVQMVASDLARQTPTRFVGLPGVRRILMTIHRRENHGEPLERILQAVRTLEMLHRGKLEFIVPVHPNPRVRSVVHAALGRVEGVQLTEPLRYDELVGVMAECELVLTDSGGLQEEAPGLGKPVLILRETTERPEGIEAGVARLVGTQTAAIVAAVSELLDDPVVYRGMVSASNPYGDGQAAARAVEALAGQTRFESPA